ncbi:MAG: hypothetical protein JXA50_01635 [Deltaproteobacteria bacterium]|nr:hypothetical protein [Deltaproteobacteria bacterium]
MSNGKEMAKRPEQPIGEELLREGFEIQKTEVGPEQFYQTALKVQKPRELEKVRHGCLYEAEIAGELFYYQWNVTAKKGKKHLVDGVSINGAMAIARNFGNCAVPVSADTQLDGSVLFKAAFVDLETGFTVARNFRAHFIEPPGKFADDPGQKARWFDMQFQKAQSQAQRNVILKGVPFWLVDMVKKTAKNSVYEQIKKMGVDQAKTAALKKFAEAYGVDQATLEGHIGKTADKWTIQDIVSLKSILRAFEEGFDSPETMFGGNGGGDGTVIDVQDIIDQFWGILAAKGIEKNDPEIVEYVKGVARFGNVPVESYISDCVAAFADSEEIDRFLKKFNEKKEKGEINIPENGQGELFDGNAQD